MEQYQEEEDNDQYHNYNQEGACFPKYILKGTETIPHSLLCHVNHGILNQPVFDLVKKVFLCKGCIPKNSNYNSRYLQKNANQYQDGINQLVISCRNKLNGCQYETTLKQINQFYCHLNECQYRQQIYCKHLCGFSTYDPLNMNRHQNNECPNLKITCLCGVGLFNAPKQIIDHIQESMEEHYRLGSQAQLTHKMQFRILEQIHSSMDQCISLRMHAGEEIDQLRKSFKDKQHFLIKRKNLLASYSKHSKKLKKAQAATISLTDKIRQKIKYTTLQIQNMPVSHHNVSVNRKLNKILEKGSSLTIQQKMDAFRKLVQI